MAQIDPSGTDSRSDSEPESTSPSTEPLPVPAGETRPYVRIRPADKGFTLTNVEAEIRRLHHIGTGDAATGFLDRQTTAEAMDTTSNVDNLQRRGREKVTDARRVVEVLQALIPNSKTDCE